RVPREGCAAVPLRGPVHLRRARLEWARGLAWMVRLWIEGAGTQSINNDDRALLTLKDSLSRLLRFWADMILAENACVVEVQDCDLGFIKPCGSRNQVHAEVFVINPGLPFWVLVDS